MRIGLISDTHGLLRPQAVNALIGVAHILHAGDIGNIDVFERLQMLAPVTAIRGNNDTGAWAAAIPETLTVTLDGIRLHLLHDVKQLAVDVAADHIQVVVAGHSHRPAVMTKNGVLYVNPGSAGPRRFTLPVSVGRLLVRNGEVQAKLIGL